MKSLRRGPYPKEIRGSFRDDLQTLFKFCTIISEGEKDLLGEGHLSQWLNKRLLSTGPVLGSVLGSRDMVVNMYSKTSLLSQILLLRVSTSQQSGSQAEVGSQLRAPLGKALLPSSYAHCQAGCWLHPALSSLPWGFTSPTLHQSQQEGELASKIQDIIFYNWITEVAVSQSWGILFVSSKGVKCWDYRRLLTPEDGVIWDHLLSCPRPGPCVCVCVLMHAYNITRVKKQLLEWQ